MFSLLLYSYIGFALQFYFSSIFASINWWLVLTHYIVKMFYCNVISGGLEIGGGSYFSGGACQGGLGYSGGDVRGGYCVVKVYLTEVTMLVVKPLEILLLYL